MPAPRVNYKDLPKETRDRIDRQEAKLAGNYKKPIGPQQPKQTQKEKAAQERQKKIDQNIENVKDRQRAEERGTTAKDFKEMKKRQDTEKKQPAQPSRTEKAKKWVQERGAAIAHETRDLRPRHNPMGNIGMRLPGNNDMFGVGQFGGIHQMMGVDPFNEMRPRSPPPTATKRRKPVKRRKARRAPAQSSGGWQPPTGIPKDLKWMF